MAERGLKENQWVDIISHFGGERRRAARFKVVPYPIPRGCAAAYFPETNVLVPVKSVADGSNQPTSKSLTITLELSAEAKSETKVDHT
jgi:anaerobic selenocysteine-containing dehydrogenase